MEPNICCPLAVPSLLLHRTCDTTDAALTVLSMEMACVEGTAAATDPVTLVDAVDELRVRG